MVVHDQLADRWPLMQFTSTAPFFLCIAVSQTANPTGAYFLYAFSTGVNFPVYPKLSVWSGAYLASTREFNGSAFSGVGTYALERSQMLIGGPAKALKVLLTTAGGAWQPGDGLLPSDLDGTALPPWRGKRAMNSAVMVGVLARRVVSDRMRRWTSLVAAPGACVFGRSKWDGSFVGRCSAGSPPDRAADR